MDNAGLCCFNPPISDPVARGVWPVVKAEDWRGHVMVPRTPRGAQIVAE